jgi:hypothetical protein
MSLRRICTGLAVLGLLLPAGCAACHHCRPGPATPVAAASPCCPAPGPAPCCPNGGGVAVPAVVPGAPGPVGAFAPPGSTPGPIH